MLRPTRLLLLIMALSALLTSACGGDGDESAQRTTPTAAEPSATPTGAPRLTGRLTVLFMGLDRREQEPPGSPARADTLFVASLDPESGTVGVLSIPRDTWAAIGPDGAESAKINTAYAYGQEREGPGGGARWEAATVERLLGVPIDRHLAVDFAGFARIVTELGGLDIAVGQTLVATGVQGWAFRPEGGVLAPGAYHMDARLALDFARYRMDSDFARIERGWQVLLAGLAAAEAGGFLDDPGAAYDRFAGAVETDLTREDAVAIAAFLRGLTPERATFRSLAGAVTAFTTADGQYALALDQGKAAEVIEAIFPGVRASQ